MESSAVLPFTPSQGVAAWAWRPWTESSAQPFTSQAERTTPQRPASAPPRRRTSAASRPSTVAFASEGMTFILKPPSMEDTRGSADSAAQLRLRTGL